MGLVKEPLFIMSRLMKSDSGKDLIEGKEITEWDEKELARK